MKHVAKGDPVQTEARMPSELGKLLLRRLQVVGVLALIWAAVGFAFRKPLIRFWTTVQTQTKARSKPGGATKAPVPVGAWIDFETGQPAMVAAGRYRLASSNFVYADHWNSTSVQVTMEFQSATQTPMRIGMGHLVMLSRDIQAIAKLCSAAGKPEGDPVRVDERTMRQIWNFKFRNAACTEQQDQLQVILQTGPRSDEPWTERIADAQNPHRSPIFFAVSQETPEPAASPTAPPEPQATPAATTTPHL